MITHARARTSRSVVLALAGLAAIPGLAQAQSNDATQGLAPLALLESKYRTGNAPGAAGLDSIRDILRASPNPELAFLFTTFGTSYDNAVSVVKPLIEEGRAPRVSIYLLNGPGRRTDQRRPYINFHPELRPNGLVDALARMDKKILADLDRTVIQPTLAFLSQMNQVATQAGKPLPRFVLIPELEDNFGRGARGLQALGNYLGVIRTAFASVPNVSYRRNPVGDGGDLNGLRLPKLPFEAHSYDISILGKLRAGDVITGDGDLFNYPEEARASGAASFDDLKKLIKAADAQGVGVLVWRAEWQGLGASGGPGNPAARHYEFPRGGTTQAKHLAELMKLGKKHTPSTGTPPVIGTPTNPTSPTTPPACCPGCTCPSCGGGIVSPVVTPTNPGGPTNPTTPGGTNPGPTNPTWAPNLIVPKGTKVDGDYKGFLWKPESEVDKKLVILPSEKFAGKVKGVNVRDSNGKVLGSGHDTATPGSDRGHFRFSKTGADYPKNCVAEVVLKDGTTRCYLIPDPSKRYD